jgi:pimeloyl-ACP methyl ester carboxylesterase
MPGLTLIHGSGQNSGAWDAVAAILRSRGHEVSTPELPKNAPDWSLSRYAEYIAAQIAGSRPRIVAAHSFSGVFLPLVAPHADAVVFVAAVIPEPGRSVRQQFEADRSMFSPEWIAAGPRWFDPQQAEALARHFLFHDCDEGTIVEALRTVEVFDTRQIVAEPSPFTNWPDTPRYSIVATGDRTLSPSWIRRMTEEQLQVRPIEIAAGHCPHNSQPQRMAGLLAAAGAGLM